MNDGGPAFPCDLVESRGSVNQHTTYPGMSLRDWFAGLAMQGLVSGLTVKNIPPATIDFTAVHQTSYMIADAMLTKQDKK